MTGPFKQAWKEVRHQRSGRRSLYCIYCRQRPSRLTRDHILPRAWSPHHLGEWNIANACRTCNSHKGSLESHTLIVLRRSGVSFEEPSVIFPVFEECLRLREEGPFQLEKHWFVGRRALPLMRQALSIHQALEGANQEEEQT